ncbi:hypothetical protein CERSUDRAFT_152319 [Gelatoporia subvermispora B]|uniref:BTB domain-containing protein n=1 Tax=Ceriporiopsis subvermispora (strain B) TaxID=914234 RepID=M2PRK3_CERS8|nr:hypothetical protein CERSUDRAFT_152319 [Gelatoporia subvermispora B]
MKVLYDCSSGVPPSPANPLSHGSHPFRKPSADVVFASSDNVVFRVHRIILAEASDFFELMFSLPQPVAQPSIPEKKRGSRKHIEQQELDGLPLLRVTETSAVLENLFRLCYPVQDPALTDLDAITDTLEAAIKYDMREATQILQERLTALVHTDPLRLYAIACRHSLEDVAAAAAAEVVRQELEVRYIDAMVHITAGTYYRLAFYAHAKGKVSAFFAFCRPSFARADDDARRGQREEFEAGFKFPPPDAMIRGADAEYGVHSAIVCQTSSVLKDLFRHASSQQSSIRPESACCADKDSPNAYGAPKLAVDLPEDRRSLATLLRLCYDQDTDHLHIDEIASALTLATKYRLPNITRRLADALRASARGDPVRVYLIASHFGLASLAQHAARLTLGVPIEPQYYPQLEDVSARVYDALLQYRRACGEAAEATLDDLSWLPHDTPPTFSNHSAGCFRAHTCKTGTRFFPCWFIAFLRHLGDALVKKPLASTATSVEWLAAALSDPAVKFCSRCERSLGVTEFGQVSGFLAGAIDRAVSQVELLAHD